MSCCAPPFTIEILDESAFTVHAGAWDDLLRRSYDNRLFYTAAWQRSWWEHLGAGGQCRILTRCDDGALRAILPLQERDGVLTLLGDPNVSDYMDAIAEKPDAAALLRELWHAALTGLQWERVELRHVPASSPLLRAVQEEVTRLGHTVSIETDEVCPVALLCSSWEGYLQILGKKQRHEIRRKLRRAGDGAVLEWRTATDRSDLESDLPVFFALHEAAGGNKAGFMTPPMRAFFRAQAQDLLERGILRLSVLSRDRHDIAACMSFLYRDRWLLYNSGYDPAQAALSPGIVAVVHALQDAIAAEAVAFDFLSGNETYKYQLGATDTHTCRVTVERRGD